MKFYIRFVYKRIKSIVNLYKTPDFLTKTSLIYLLYHVKIPNLNTEVGLKYSLTLEVTTFSPDHSPLS